MEYKKTILIIDDMKHIRNILWFTLKQEGYRPLLAKDGAQGLQLLFDSNEKVDLILLDVMMPKMDGFEVLTRIRTTNHTRSKVPVIMLTAKAQKEDVIRGMKTGASDYIIKPYTFDDLLAKIQGLIG